MAMSTQTTHWLDVVAKILLRCWVFGVIVLLFWFGAVMLAGDLVYGVHASMFDLTLRDLQVIHYCGMGLTKLAVSLLFFIPWLSIKLVQGKLRASTGRTA